MINFENKYRVDVNILFCLQRLHDDSMLTLITAKTSQISNLHQKAISLRSIVGKLNNNSLSSFLYTRTKIMFCPLNLNRPMIVLLTQAAEKSCSGVGLD